MLRLGGLDGEPPAWHLSKPAYPGPNAERTFPSKFNGNQAKRLVARWHERELGSAENKRRDGRELWLGVDSARVPLHNLLQFEGGELAMVVDSRSDANELNVFVFVHDFWEGVCNEVHALLK